MAEKRTCDACGLTFIPPFVPGWTWTTNIPVWKGRCPRCTEARVAPLGETERRDA